MPCLFCNKEIKNKGSLKSHELVCKFNPNRVKRTRSIHAGAKKGCIPWNKGKKTNQIPWNKELKGITGTKHSEKTKNHLSKIAINRGLGGYVRGSGRGKKGWYNGFFCDSSWELAYVIYCLDHGIKISRNKEKRQYIWEGRIKNYIPDFIVEGKLVEIKGYKTQQWIAKHKFNQDVIVFYEEDLTEIITYVRHKYGNNFIDLYEGR